MLGDPQRAIWKQRNVDLSLGERKRLGDCGRRNDEYGQDDRKEGKRPSQNSTFGTVRPSSSTSKKTPRWKPVTLATRFVGIVSTALLYDSVVSL